MSNSEYREAQQQARTAGLAKRHEQRLENATYTAAEVKVLTEAASKLGYELGRRGENAAIEALRELVELKDGPRDADYERRKPAAWDAAREVIRDLTSAASLDAAREPE